jgi:hypothetical protein
MKRLNLIFLVLGVLFFGVAHSQDLRPTVSLVYPGTDGKLVYVADSLGNKIPDFSNAGYKGGGVPIPFVAIKETVWPVRGDNSANIQAAIDKVSALPVDESGFRGAVLLKMGTYDIEKPIYIKASGVVLRGEGNTDIGTILIGKIPKDRQTYGRGAGLINIAGPKAIAPQEDTKQLVTDNYVSVGSCSFNVASAKAYKAGDKILVRRYGNQDWIKAIGLDSATVGRNRWRPFTITYDRVIKEVKGNTIVIDAPVLTAVESRWGGGDIVKYTDERIEQSGVEYLRGISEYNPSVRTVAYGNMNVDSFDDPKIRYEGNEYYSDENHVNNFVVISNAKNIWVRNLSALHFPISIIQSNAGSKWITVQDCESREPVSIRMGARRFIYQMNGQLCLVQRCFSQKGRHSFVMQNQEASGNVYLDCTAVNPYSSSEPHNHWVNGCLYDNIKAPLTARFWNYIIGWAGANIVFWNCEGDFVCQSPPTANNYSFGHVGLTSVIFNTALQDVKAPRGHIESLDYHVTPRSLYLTQLKERLGMEAVNNVIAEGQTVK